MELFKKILLGSFVITLSGHAFANVIELDALNADHCRQQILQSKDEVPIIATYSSDKYNGASKKFMEKFEQLANSHPEKTFYKWDAEKDWLRTTKSLCMQQAGFFITPYIMMVGVFQDPNDKTKNLMTAPLRMQWAGDMTMEQLTTFITFFDPNDSSRNTLKKLMVSHH